MRVTRKYVAVIAVVLGGVAISTNGQTSEQDEPLINLSCGFDGGEVACEEIVVTRKRVELVDEVPVSLTLVPGDTLKEQGQYDLAQLSSIVTNLHYSANVGPSDNIVMRGLGTVGAGPQFEPAVGQLFNGVFLGRSRFGRVPWFDLRQVEIFRGPQGVVIGKNHSLGAVSVIPNRPTDSFYGSAFGSYELDDAPGVELEGVVSGPLSERVRARLAVRSTNRDGWYENDAAPVSAPERDDLAVRAMFDIDLTDTAELEVLWQHLDIEHSGKPREIVYCSLIHPAGRAVQLGEHHPERGDCMGDSRHRSIEAASPGNEPWNTTSDLGTIHLTQEFSSVRLDVLAGVMRYSMYDVVDADLDPEIGVARPALPADLSYENNLANNEEYDQRSIEVRLGAGSAVTDYLVGLNYLSYDISYWQDHNIQNIRPPFFRNGTKRRIFADVDDDSLGMFFDLNRYIGEKVTLNVGLRALTERKSANTSRRAYSVDDLTVPTTLAGQRALNDDRCRARSGFVLCSDVDDSRRDRALSYNASLRWLVKENNMLFFSAATGWKSGGFNLTADRTQAQLIGSDRSYREFNYDPEDTVSIEIGGRHASGYVSFDWTLFRTRVNDLQVSSFSPGSISHATHNDAAAESRGVEVLVDYTRDRLALRLSAAYTDATYLRFNEAPCYVGQRASTGCVVFPNGSNPNPTQNLTGRRLARAPELQAVADLAYRVPLGTNALTLQAKVITVGDYLIDTELRPLAQAKQAGYTKYDVGMRFGDGGGRWTIALLAKNLADVRTYNFFNEIGLLNPYVGVGSGFAFADVGRTVTLSAQFRFGGRQNTGSSSARPPSP